MAKKKLIPRPEEGIPFKVNPSGIDRSIFQNKREDICQEQTRRFILEAFAKMDENPGRYGKSFRTMIPVKTWEGKKVAELKEFASKLGNHMANWVEQFLECAQRIHNGETWEAICNEPDTSNWYRLIERENGHVWLVGGSYEINDCSSASFVHIYKHYELYDELCDTVPLVVI